MGDRANVVVLNGPDREVYLYTHWGGHELPETLRQALLKRWRWMDEQYLARIIFDHMTEGDRGETGFGISARLGDGSYPLLVVDTEKQTVHTANESTPRQAKKSWTFEEYIAELRTWENIK